MGSFEYATLYNKAMVAAGKVARFSDEDLKKFQDGSDPEGTPIPAGMIWPSVRLLCSTTM